MFWWLIVLGIVITQNSHEKTIFTHKPFKITMHDYCVVMN